MNNKNSCFQCGQNTKLKGTQNNRKLRGKTNNWIPNNKYNNNKSRVIKNPNGNDNNNSIRLMSHFLMLFKKLNFKRLCYSSDHGGKHTTEEWMTP